MGPVQTGTERAPAYSPAPPVTQTAAAGGSDPAGTL
jgi:hypothetical protein